MLESNRVRENGRVAQLVEQCPFKAWVAGSNPAALTITYGDKPRRIFTTQLRYCCMYPATTVFASVSIRSTSLPAPTTTNLKFNALSPFGVIFRLPVH